MSAPVAPDLDAGGSASGTQQVPPWAPGSPQRLEAHNCCNQPLAKHPSLDNPLVQAPHPPAALHSDSSRNPAMEVRPCQPCMEALLVVSHQAVSILLFSRKSHLRQGSLSLPELVLCVAVSLMFQVTRQACGLWSWQRQATLLPHWHASGSISVGRLAQHQVRCYIRHSCRHMGAQAAARGLGWLPVPLPLAALYGSSYASSFWQRVFLTASRG